MSREILFRGQTRKKGEKVRLDGTPLESNWVYGCGVFVPNNSNALIYQSIPVFEKYPIYPETLGQYTGLTDKNGVKIFEGDIIKTHYVNTKKSDFIEQVVFHNGRFCAYSNIQGCNQWVNLYDGIKHLPQDKSVYMDSIEVIGNIFDNPELINDD